jgi:hypothetical protein
MSRRPQSHRTVRTAGIAPARRLLAVGAAALVLAGSAAPAAAGTPRRTLPHRLGPCGAGALCLWEDPGFEGRRLTYELAGTDIESCVALPSGFTGDAYANRTGRPVTFYQSAECATTGEFDTHPSGSWTPHSDYQARAFTIWER